MLNYQDVVANGGACFETLDFPLRAGREMRIAEKVLVFQNIGLQTDVPIICKGYKYVM